MAHLLLIPSRRSSDGEILRGYCLSLHCQGDHDGSAWVAIKKIRRKGSF
ncbi:hypothetical protein PVAP13_9KG335632 [Panicum virgatum]|uniref:Uncharacterized protein n=1 Tax=Panicum virgatum TaxID=38727 RepID=A0A8T0NR87_PANVG|nr:hypothetical protein PVAP13_9KG335632 [Panicum virgatum]